MRAIFCALVLVVLQATASPYNGQFKDVIEEAKNLNSLISNQLNDLDMDGTDSTAQPTSTDSQMTDQNTDSQTTDALTTSNPPHETYQPTKMMKPLDKMLKELPLMKESYKDFVKFYWSLHMIRKMIEKHTMMLMGMTKPKKTLPFLLPPSTLIKTAMKQLQDVSKCVDKMAEVAKKLDIKMSHKKCDDDDDWNFGESELQFFLKAEMKTAKVYWMTKILINFVKKLNETKNSGMGMKKDPKPRRNRGSRGNGANQGVNKQNMMTTEAPIVTIEDFFKKFAKMILIAKSELPALFKQLKQMKMHIEAKENKVLKKFGMKHHD